MLRMRIDGCRFKPATCDSSLMIEQLQAMLAGFAHMRGGLTSTFVESVGDDSADRKLLTSADSGTAASQAAPVSKRPPEKAFQAWQIRELVGISKQGDIAEMMTTRGVSATQGQVSKWLAAVEEWRRAGGLMPEVGDLDSEPQSVDPDILDMGARRDGRTPRQRDRRDSDADE
jgi:hypothetical protein